MIYKNAKLLAYTILLILITACANTPQSSNSSKINTIADARLKADVMRMIGIYESAAGGSSRPKLIAAAPQGKEGPSYVEQWIVTSKGKSVPYRIKLTPSPRGGVDYAITRLNQ